MPNSNDVQELVKMLESVTFIAETVAHLRGLEREILPATDAARTLLEKYKLPSQIIKAGDCVAFATQVDAGDCDLRMVALEDEDGGRVLVQSIVGMNINPTHRFDTSELKVVQCAS